MELTEFLLARIAEDEAVARGAVDPERPGTHWHWIDAGENGGPAEPDAGTDGEYLDMDASLWLCTVEEFPTRSVGPLPAVAISHAEEVKTGAALHIARHDPARVLAECEAKRRIVEMHAYDWNPRCLCMACDTPGPCATLRTLALPYRDHSDFDPAWEA